MLPAKEWTRAGKPKNTTVSVVAAVVIQNLGLPGLWHPSKPSTLENRISSEVWTRTTRQLRVFAILDLEPGPGI